MAAEQVLYSWMSIEGAPGHRLFKRLPCGWNVQLGSWHAGINLEDANSPRRQCSRCDVLHGAGAEGKEALGILTRELSAGKSCVDAFESVRTRRHYQPKGSLTEALLLRGEVRAVAADCEMAGTCKLQSTEGPCDDSVTSADTTRREKSSRRPLLRQQMSH